MHKNVERIQQRARSVEGTDPTLGFSFSVAEPASFRVAQLIHRHSSPLPSPPGAVSFSLKFASSLFFLHCTSIITYSTVSLLFIRQHTWLFYQQPNPSLDRPIAAFRVSRELERLPHTVATTTPAVQRRTRVPFT